MNLEGANLGGLEDKSPPAGSRGGAPVGGLGDEVGAGDATYNNERSPPEADDFSQLKGYLDVTTGILGAMAPLPPPLMSASERITSHNTPLPYTKGAVIN